MRVSRASKALFIIFNHVTASLVPHGSVTSTLGSKTNGDLDTVFVPRDGKDLLSSFNGFTSLFSRQSNNKDQNEACERCRKKCPRRFIKDPDNCRKCVRCPPGQRGNTDSTKCLVDKALDPKDTKEKEKRYQQRRNNIRRGFKEKKFPEKKKAMQMEYEDRKRARANNENRKKVRYMSRCLTIVPLAMGGEFAKEFAGEYFDEAFLENYVSDMLQYWPSDLSVPPWDNPESDKIYDNEEFINQYVEHGNSHTKRWLEEDPQGDKNTTLGETGGVRKGVERVNTINPYDRSTSDLIVREDLEERFFHLIPILIAALSTAARAGAVAARIGTAILRVAKDTVKVVKGRASKNSYRKQADGFGKIARDGQKFWRSCLMRSKPPK